MVDKKPRRQRALARISDYKATFESRHGQNVLHDLMHTHFMMASTFDINPAEMARKEGERNVILRIMSILKVDIKELEHKIKEASNAAAED